MALGRVDILVNNAGMNIRKPPQDYALAEWNQVLQTNLSSAFCCSQAVYPEFKKQGAGKIINIGSMMSIFGASFATPYAASKGGLVQMTKAMAIEWGRYGINVNAICPGYINTEINHHHWETEQGKKLVNMFPKKRLGQPHDLDALLVMLASPQSDFINGAVISADDGFSI